MNKLQGQLFAYHRKMGFTINHTPTPVELEQAIDRSDIQDEEGKELRRALLAKDIVKIADGIGDVIYVAVGTGVACGIDVDHILDEIHRSNMTKTPPKGHTGKAIKGPHYSPPNLEPILIAQKAVGEVLVDTSNDEDVIAIARCCVCHTIHCFDEWSWVSNSMSRFRCTNCAKLRGFKFIKKVTVPETYR